MKKWLVRGAFSLAAAAAPIAMADTAAAKEPEAMAVSFMQMLYGKEAEVAVTIVERSSRHAVAKAVLSDGKTCNLDMVPAPGSYESRHGWFVGSIVCD